MDTLGSRLKSLREEKNLTLEQVANCVGTTKVSIGRYEKDEREPKSEMLNLLADFFHVSVDYLLGRTTIQEPTLTEFKPKLTEKYKINIEKEALQMIENIDKAKVVEFCGNPADDEDKEFLRLAYEKFLSDVRVYNKMKYTPKKFKK